MKNRKKGNRGFTLLEVMIAVGLIVFSIASVYTSFIYAVLLNQTNGNLVMAANDAQYVLEQLRGVSYSSIATYAPPALNSLPGESITIQKNIGWRIAEVTANVSWTENNRSRSFALKTRIAK